MIDTILGIISPREKLKLAPCEMLTTMNYYARLERNALEPVESECGNVKKVMLVASPKPHCQRYIGIGRTVLQMYPIRRD